MSNKINPKWKQYNDLNNEGCEGFNPHRKFIESTNDKKAKSTQINNARSFCKDEKGNTITSEKLSERLKNDLEVIKRLTNDSAIKITQESINFAKKELGLTD